VTVSVLLQSASLLFVVFSSSLEDPLTFGANIPSTNANCSILRDTFASCGVLCDLGHEFYNAMRAFKADRHHFLNADEVRGTILSYIVSVQQLLHSVVNPPTFGTSSNWFPLDPDLVASIRLPPMSLPEDGLWELAPGGVLSCEKCEASFHA
jgi:hypothetical protein